MKQDTGRCHFPSGLASYTFLTTETKLHLVSKVCYIHSKGIRKWNKITLIYGKLFKSGHAVPIPIEVTPPKETGKIWYLPHFGVYHPHKPNKIRVVFDSSAEFEGTSLNKVLLSGPDMHNSLLGILVRVQKKCHWCDV